MRVLGFHFIFSAYGFWLPNDPRGSWSETVRQWELLRYGPATKVTTTRSLAQDSHDAGRRRAAKRALRYPSVTFDGRQARAVTRGFAVASNEAGYDVLALAVLPDHAHLVMRWHARHVDDIASHLKARATRQLSDEGLHPMAPFADARGRKPSPWARNHWCPFIRTDAYLRRAVRYVEENPPKQGLPRQRWDFVVPV